VEGDSQLPGKKGFYVKMGCRGDWPVLQPPGWDGNKETMVDGYGEYLKTEVSKNK
jgi:hypothetical protein